LAHVRGHLDGEDQVLTWLSCEARKQLAFFLRVLGPYSMGASSLFCKYF